MNSDFLASLLVRQDLSCQEVIVSFNSDLNRVAVTVKQLPETEKECKIPILMIDKDFTVRTYEQVVQLDACQLTCKSIPID